MWYQSIKSAYRTCHTQSCIRHQRVWWRGIDRDACERIRPPPLLPCVYMSHGNTIRRRSRGTSKKLIPLQSWYEWRTFLLANSITPQPSMLIYQEGWNEMKEKAYTPVGNRNPLQKKWNRNSERVWKNQTKPPSTAIPHKLIPNKAQKYSYSKFFSLIVLTMYTMLSSLVTLSALVVRFSKRRTMYWIHAGTVFWN